MYDYVVRNRLKVEVSLAEFIEKEAIKGLPFTASNIWERLSGFIETFTPENERLLKVREELERKINEWEIQHGKTADPNQRREFLSKIGYLVDAPEDFSLETKNVDPEIGSIAGPQLVVPVSNARYVLNAANARWGSLYDALYGTDALAPPQFGGYDKVRGDKVIAWSKAFLDQHFPFAGANYADLTDFNVVGETLLATKGGQTVQLKDVTQFVGYKGPASNPDSVLLRHNDLHVALKFDRTHSIGRGDIAGIYDVELESAISSIVDFEDSVAAVDGEDKTLCYRNWLGLMTGSLKQTFDKGGKTVTRELDQDRELLSPSGEPMSLRGRSLLLVRNVGHLMTTPAVLRADGSEVFEGLLDAFITSLIAIHDLDHAKLNSQAGSVYIVKPKMHGPDEAAFANKTLDAVEDALNLPRHTLKIGLMDEERRTSVNLAACISALRHRLIFINTGFLDRTGDEIHTAMNAGPVRPKGDMKSAKWLAAYEGQNVTIGLSAGFRGKAQIGKGMWAKPDYMSEMLRDKVSHPKSGATCAWVPSPTAATLHATHYHEVSVVDAQNSIDLAGTSFLSDLLDVPVSLPSQIDDEAIDLQVRDCCQSILGYVTRWIDQGVGCSKVPDVNDIGLMEDRATLRISCQLLANWLKHDLITKKHLIHTFNEMAHVVDRQNADDPFYEAIHPNPQNSMSFRASLELVMEGGAVTNGYTEPTLHSWRREKKHSALISAKEI